MCIDMRIDMCMDMCIDMRADIPWPCATHCWKALIEKNKRSTSRSVPLRKNALGDADRGPLFRGNMLCCVKT